MTLFIGADVDKSSVRVFAEGDVDKKGRDIEAKALAKLVDECFFDVCDCSGEVEYGVFAVVAEWKVVARERVGGVLPVEYGVTGSERTASLPHGPFEDP